MYRPFPTFKEAYISARINYIGIYTFFVWEWWDNPVTQKEIDLCWLHMKICQHLYKEYKKQTMFVYSIINSDIENIGEDTVVARLFVFLHHVYPFSMYPYFINSLYS